MKVFIKREVEDALWLVVEREGEKGVAHPILEDEVKPIRDACDKWLNHLSDSGKKEEK